MIAMLFSGAPVVAWVPPGGRASGAATFALMTAGLIAAAPDARIGTRRGLGRDADMRLGSFGAGLFESAQRARSGAVDWFVVSLAEGSEIDGREARRRGIVSVVAGDEAALARALAGREVTVPLTDARVRLSGRIHRESGDALARAAGLLGHPHWSVPLLVFSLLVLAILPARGGSMRLALLLAATAALALGALRAVPISAIGATLLGGAASIAWATPHVGRALAGLAGALAAGACATFVDTSREGTFLADDFGPTTLASALVGIVLCAVLVASTRPRPVRPATHSVL